MNLEEIMPPKNEQLSGRVWSDPPADNPQYNQPGVGFLVKQVDVSESV